MYIWKVQNIQRKFRKGLFLLYFLIKLPISCLLYPAESEENTKKSFISCAIK